MPRTARSERQVSLSLRLFTGGLILLFVVLIGMAACPELHEHLHGDASSPDHHCAITLIASGACEVSESNVPAFGFVPLAVFVTDALHPVWVESLFRQCSSLEHAPPALS